MARLSVNQWQKVRLEYETSQFSDAELGRRHKVSAPAIRKKAKKENWKRDLAKKVRQLANEKLVHEDAKVSIGSRKVSTGESRETFNEEQEVELAAQTRVAVLREHRVVIGKGMKLCNQLADDLFQAMSATPDIEEQVDKETADDSNSKRRDSMLKAISIPTHAGSLDKLANAITKIISLERTAFNLNDEKDDKGLVVIPSEDTEI